MQSLLPSPKIDPAELRDVVGDPRWRLACRIAASGCLGRSKLMSDFLLYVVERQILGRHDEITEQQIGVLVFARREGYDSNEDNIVRSYARNLRKRLEEYFSGEGSFEDLRLEIPRGGYVPQFSTCGPQHATLSELGSGPDYAAVSAGTDSIHAATSVEVHEGESAFVEPEILTDHVAKWPTPEDSHAKKSSMLRLNVGGIAVACGIALVVTVVLLLPSKQMRQLSRPSTEATSNVLWSQIFSRDRDTFVVPSDDGLIIMQGLTARPVPLASYIDGSYRTNIKTDGNPSAAEILKLGGRRYTSVVDLDFVAHVAQLDEVVPERLVIRYARDVRMDDLRNGNAILIGSTEANPWIELFQAQLNFRFSIHASLEQPSGIINLHPLPGEKPIYGTPGKDHTYGVIAYVANLSSTGHVLIVGGLNTAGTQAATTFLLTPALMKSVLDHATSEQGKLCNFEVLVEAVNVAANASTPEIVLERVNPL
jgi:hypothetical protein